MRGCRGGSWSPPSNRRPSGSPPGRSDVRSPIRSVAIVGAGFSGALLAVNLARRGGVRVALVERTDRVGRGLAYGAAQPHHLLNVRAGDMSGFPDDRGHFARWLAARGVANAADAFMPRPTYGEYLVDLLAEARRSAGGRLEVVVGDVTDIDVAESDATVRLADGRTVAADAAVLALGNLPPADPPGVDPAALPTAAYWGDPWAPGLADGLSDADTVLAIGTGLTTIDVALTLDARGFRGRIIALSRRGLTPRAHAAVEPPCDRLAEPPPVGAAALLRAVRARAGSRDWRCAVDELRPFTQAMWAAASDADRARFLRHLRAWWDVHRHRLAPELAHRLAAMRASGRLEVVAGKLARASTTADGRVAVVWRPRGEAGERETVVRRIVNCTGPRGDVAHAGEPLLTALLAAGAIRADQRRLGIDTDAQGAAVRADGRPNDRLFVIGPMTKGAFWEIVAVPDIRGQAAALADRLAGAGEAANRAA